MVEEKKSGRLQRLEALMARIPQAPGVYLMKDSAGRLLYVGKAARLRNRVRDHFRPAPEQSPWSALMSQRVADVEWIVTDSPVEALLLENNLIKQRRPRFNLRLTDDKTYPYLMLTAEEDYPRLLVTRKPTRGGSRYFGPYASAAKMWETKRVIHAVFGLRSCNTPPERWRRACLDLELGRCLGPCTGRVSKEEYQRAVEEAIEFLEGRAGDLLRRLRKAMEQAAEALQFERAAKVRDQMQAIESVLERQKTAAAQGEDFDVIGLAHRDEWAAVCVFAVRDGDLVGRDEFVLTGALQKLGGEIIEEYVQQLYSNGRRAPGLIAVSVAPEGKELLEGWLSAERGAKVEITVPQRGAKRALLALANKNAQLSLDSFLSSAEQQRKQSEALGEALARGLGLANRPNRVECYDISTIQGVHTVGSMVVFEGGQANKKQYRMYKLRSAEAFRDDYAALHEVLQRRFARAASGDERFASGLPDLLMVDGGPGQLSVARQVLGEVGLEIPTVSLAKKHEQLYVSWEGKPRPLPTDPALLRFFQRVRDEAHRFAVSYHVKLRGRAQLHSILEEIPGVGPARRQALLKHFGSMKRLREASADEIAETPGVDCKTAGIVHDFLRAAAASGAEGEGSEQ